jgi:hypothetical protein
MLRLRHPDIRVDLDGLSEAPLIENYCLEPQARGDGADLVALFNGAHVRIASVQALDDETGWAWAYGQGLVRLGRPLDRALDRTVNL